MMGASRLISSQNPTTIRPYSIGPGRIANLSRPLLRSLCPSAKAPPILDCDLLILNSRVQHRVDEVEDQVDDRHEQRCCQHEAGDREIVAVRYRLHGVLSQSTPREDSLAQDGAAEKKTVREGDHGDN